MAFAFDTLGYSKRLRDAGVTTDHAEAHAEAARDFIMTELVTKSDLLALQSSLKSDLLVTRNELQASIDKLGLQMTVRLGGMVALGIGILAAVQRMH